MNDESGGPNGQGAIFNIPIHRILNYKGTHARTHIFLTKTH